MSFSGLSKEPIKQKENNFVFLLIVFGFITVSFLVMWLLIQEPKIITTSLIIEQKKHEPERKEVYYTWLGKIPISHSTVIKENWLLRTHYKDNKVNCNIRKEQFEKLNIGNSIIVKLKIPVIPIIQVICKEVK